MKNDEAIGEANRKALESGHSDAVRLKHNRFSDLSKEERMGLLGGIADFNSGSGKPGENTNNQGSQDEEEYDGGRRNLCD